MLAIKRVSRKCGRSRLHRHWQWSGGKFSCVDTVPREKHLKIPVRHPQQRHSAPAQYAKKLWLLREGRSLRLWIPSSYLHSDETGLRPPGHSTGTAGDQSASSIYLYGNHLEVVTAAGRRDAHRDLALVSGAILAPVSPFPVEEAGAVAAFVRRRRRPPDGRGKSLCIGPSWWLVASSGREV